MNRLEDVRKETQNIRLNDEERKQLRESLVSYMEKNPIPPSEGRLKMSRGKKAGLFAVLVGFLVCGVGIASAAQGTLPGNALYPVKTNITEKIEGLFAFSPERKAYLGIKFAERRLREAEALEAQSRLDVYARVELSEKFKRHVMTYETNVQKIRMSNAPSSADSIESAFASSVSNYARVLAELTSMMN